ncbi:MAG TPA: CHAT domain-containing protein, partial [Bacteroidetes bacterium]|nr:CHAT domain-containing protein [Bacteroidota bacterium]
DIARSYFNIGETYDGQGNYRKALEYHKKALDIRIKGLGESHPYVAAGYNSIGEIYFKQGRHDTALEYCQKALNILLNSFGKNHLDVALYYNNIANIYEKKRDYDLAIKNHKIALSISLKELGKGHPNVAESYNRLGEIYYKLKNYEKAVEYNEKAIDCLQQMRKHFTTIESKQFHLSEKQSIFENSIRNILEANSFDSTQFDLKQTFTYAETGKGNLLLDALNSSQAKYFANIPEPLLQKEYDLITDITYYDKKRQEKLLEGMDENDTTILAFSSKQFGLNRQYEVLVNQLETDYPQYYQAKYNFTTLTVNHVQDHLLAENQTLLEYFVGDSSIFIFLIQKNNYEVKEIKRDFPLKDWVQQMTKEGIYGYHALSIYDPLKTDSLQDAATLNYATAAQNLYKKLISPFENKLTKNLLIIPDGVLNYLPFEALLTEAPARIGSYKSYPYMLKKHQISYSYSATLLDEMRQKQHRRAPEGKLLAMAPFFDGDVEELNIRIDTTDIFADINRSEPLLPLPNSGEEIATISKLFDGTPIYGTAASLTQFQQQAESYRILHLATHGKADDRVGDYAYLAFAVPGDVGEFDKLYARDLYNYSLNADMVVLSACETGTGKLQKGEGIISLSRAFAYAGAKSIFPTLWQVSDEKTKDLLIGFYKYLKIGKPKDEALRLAKLDFLESNAGNGIGTHPYFWAGLIGIGDMRAVR